MYIALLIIIALFLCHAIRVIFSFLLYIRSDKVLQSVFTFFNSLCCQALTLVLIWNSGSALLSFGSHGNYLSENIQNYTAFLFSSGHQFINNIKNGTFPSFHSGLITTVWEYFEDPSVTHVLLFLILNNQFHFLSKISRLFRKLTWESVPKQSCGEWLGVWDDVSRYLSRVSPPIVLNFTPEQVLNPKKLVECLRVVCPDPDNAGERQLAALCWVLAYSYQTLFNIIQQLEEREEVSEYDDQVTHDVADPKDQPTMVSVAPIVKSKKWKRKSARLVREEGSPKEEEEGEMAGTSKAGPSQKQQEDETEIIKESEITRSLSLSEMREIRKDYGRRPGEHILTWLLRCWDAGANSLQLEGNEAKQLGSLSRERVIDKVIGRGAQALSLWRRLLAAVRERYPHKEDIVYQIGKWTTIDKGLQHLRELAVREMIYSDLDNAQTPQDPDEVQCTTSMWRKFVRSAPPAHASTLASINWDEGRGPTLYDMSCQLQKYEDNLSAPLQSSVSAVEKLSKGLDKLVERVERVYSPSFRQSDTSATKNQHSRAQEREYPRRTPRGTLWFFLRDHGEDMRKWDGVPTSTLAARVRELKGNTAARRGVPKRNAAPVSMGQYPRGSRRADVILDPDEETSTSHLQELSGRRSSQD